MTINIFLLILWIILLFVWVRNFVVDKNRSAIVWIIVSILWIIVETFCILNHLIPLSWFNTFTNSLLLRIYKLCSSILSILLSFFSYFRTISKLQFLLPQLLTFFLHPSGSSVLFYKLLIFLSPIALLKSKILSQTNIQTLHPQPHYTNYIYKILIITTFTKNFNQNFVSNIIN